MPAIIHERSGHLAHIRLNRPDNGNRFTTEMFRTLAQLFTALDADPEIRCTLLTANGEDFSLGVDVPDVLPAWATGKSPFEDSQVNPFGTTGPKRRKPLVTVVHGQCFNAGLELVFASDICIAADNCRFAFHEMRFGVYPFGVYPFGGGLFRFIRAAGWNAAMRYSLTSEEFGADEARCGPQPRPKPLVSCSLGKSATPLPLPCRPPSPRPRHGRIAGRGCLRAFGTGYHPVAELTRCGSGDGRGESSGVFRTVRAKREHPRFGARSP